MNSFLGPLGSTHNYIAHVALPNCIDYFNLLKKHREEGACRTPEKFKEFRYALNAIESLNNILEYRYHELQRWGQPLKEFKKEFFLPDDIPKFVGEIEAFANAYKHSIRGSWQERLKKFVMSSKAKHAKDITKNTIYFRAGSHAGRPLTDIQYSFESIDLEEIISLAVQYWVKRLDRL